MKHLLPLILSCLLFSCVEAETDDLNTFVIDTKSKVYPINDEIPTLKKIDTVNFTESETRSPFSQPQVETKANIRDMPKSCPQPDLDRKKQALESFPIESMKMRGTLLLDGQLWALIQVAGNEVHKVKPGYYLGTSYGKVIKVSSNKIDLLELAPDRNGCWKERITQIDLVSERT